MPGIDMKQLDTVLKEVRRFKPPAAFQKGAHIRSEAEYRRLYKESIQNPSKFWARVASDLHWFKKWSKVLDSSKAPFYRWFVGGKTSRLQPPDRHPDSPTPQGRLVCEGEPGDRRAFTYTTSRAKPGISPTR
jgi:acetyl-CoA synthetase